MQLSQAGDVQIGYRQEKFQIRNNINLLDFKLFF